MSRPNPEVQTMRCAITLLLMVAVVPPWAAASEEVEEVVALASGYVAEYGSTTPGALIAVVRDGEVVARQITGAGDLGGGVPLAADSQMRIASLTTQFVAVAVMLLVEDGRIALDDPVGRHLPVLREVVPAATVRHLLQHTSGLPHHSMTFMNTERVPHDPGPPAGFLFAPLGSRPDDFMPTNEDVIDLLVEFPDLRFEPGTRWEYSNAGYVVLAQIVERVSGRPFHQFVRRELFAPLGMSSSGVLDERQPELKRRAYSYVVTDDGFEERDYSPFNLLHGDGGIYSTLDDLIAWRRAFEPGVLLDRSSIAEIMRPARLDDGTRVTDTPRGAGYGMGWFLQDVDGRRELLHGGGWAAFRHAIHFVPEEDVWVVVLTNRSDTQPYEMAEALATAAAKDR